MRKTDGIRRQDPRLRQELHDDFMRVAKVGLDALKDVNPAAHAAMSDRLAEMEADSTTSLTTSAASAPRPASG